MKDLFSDKSDEYARFRPQYPEKLINYISGLCASHENVWDCATGNGQFAKELTTHFKNIFATDISEQQLANAPVISNIFYSKQKAEKTDFKNSFFDLIVVAQAVHWFDFNSFYSEVKRTLKPNGIIALVGYGLFKTNSELDVFIDDFYINKIGKYWDPERKFIDDKYKTIPFPFTQIKTPDFEISYSWNTDQLIGYLKTWSAVKNYKKENAIDAIDADFLSQLKRLAGTSLINIKIPVFVRVGKL